MDLILILQDYLEYIIKINQTIMDNHPIKIYVTKIENSITSKIKTGYYLELLTLEIMKLLKSTERKITNNECCENVAYLEITEAVIIHCNVINNNIFILDKSFDQLLDISPKIFTFLKIFNSDFSYIAVWFND